MRDRGGDAFAQAEGVTAHKISARGVRVVERVEEEGGAGGEQVLDVLLQRVDLSAGRIFCDEAVIVDGVDISLFRNRIAETSARRVLERYAPAGAAFRLKDKWQMGRLLGGLAARGVPRLVSQYALDVIAVV